MSAPLSARLLTIAAVLAPLLSIVTFSGRVSLRVPTYCDKTLKRAIYTGRVALAQARRADEMQAVADALSLLANIAMAWNTAQMQAVLGRWAHRRHIVPPEMIGRIAPTRLEGINLRGVFRFPVERYTGQLLPSQTTAKTSASG